MNDEEYGSRLLHPLRGEPAGPPTIDVVRAMREGRRQRRRWWAGGSALAALLAAGLTGGLLMADRDPRPDPIPPAACTVAALPTGSHKSVMVTGGDPTGAWIVGSTHQLPGSAPNSILVWHDGKLVGDLEPPNLRRGSGGVWMTDVNASGVAVGGNFDNHPEPYIIEAGRIKKLAGGLADAVAINDAGVIAGQAGPPDKERPVRWASPDAEPVPLPLPDDYKVPSSIVDVTPDGTVIGQINWKTYLWRPDGTHGYLEPPPAPDRPTTEFEPAAFSNGWLYGTRNTSFIRSKSGPTVFRYELRTGAWQNLGTGRQTAMVAGSKSDRAASDEPKTYAGDSILSLPSYVFPAPAGRTNSSVQNISDDARIVAGTAYDYPNDGSRPSLVPVIWRCR